MHNKCHNSNLRGSYALGRSPDPAAIDKKISLSCLWSLTDRSGDQETAQEPDGGMKRFYHRKPFPNFKQLLLNCSGLREQWF
jgi:hypothetical protein